MLRSSFFLLPRFSLASPSHRTICFAKMSTTPGPLSPKFVPVERSEITSVSKSDGFKFSLVSYNILAQAYVKSALFPLSPGPCLKWKARSQAILKVLKSLETDFLCLQELDEYDNFYKENIESYGYSSIYVQRSGQKRDGCGIFYKKDSAELVIEEKIDYNDLVPSIQDDTPVDKEANLPAGASQKLASKGVFKKAIRIYSYISQRPLLLNLMRKFTKQRNLVKPAKTRFATAFLTLQAMYFQRKNLKSLVISTEWTSSRFAKEAMGKEIVGYLLSAHFWNNVVRALKICGPLVTVLRLVDGEKKPPMGYIYEAMDRAKESIEKAFNKVKKEYEKVFEIIDRRWNDQLHRPLHAAGFLLNPGLYYTAADNYTLHPEIMEGYFSCVEKMVPDVATQDLLLDELSKYKAADGMFGCGQAIRARDTRSPDVGSRDRREDRGDINDPCVRLKRDCVGIMAAFRLKGPCHLIIVANTHLYWDPELADVKLAQAKYLLSRLAQFKLLVSDKFDCSPSVVVAGDFNSLPGDQVYQYLISGSSVVGTLPESSDDVPIPLCSVYASTRGEPHFTNSNPGFTGTLDYVLFSPSGDIKPVSYLELPEPEASDVQGGLPNYYHPSDHLPIGAEFELVQ